MNFQSRRQNLADLLGDRVFVSAIGQHDVDGVDLSLVAEVALGEMQRKEHRAAAVEYGGTAGASRPTIVMVPMWPSLWTFAERNFTRSPT